MSRDVSPIRDESVEVYFENSVKNEVMGGGKETEEACNVNVPTM